MACLNVERLGMAAVGTGNAFKVLDYTLDYAKSRLAFGKPISKFQSIQHKLADMRIMAENARLLTYRVAELIDNGQPCVLETSMAKIVATDANFNCANLGLQIMGGAGYTCAYDMEMFFRDARVGPIGGGSNEIQRNIMGKLLDC
jgi:alkylation response protein AidB-like acyl-CoA dehydrogenase